MADVDKLGVAILESGLKKTFIAGQLNISYNTFMLSLHGKRAFTLPEARKLCELLRLDPEQEAEIFLP